MPFEFLQNIVPRRVLRQCLPPPIGNRALFIVRLSGTSADICYEKLDTELDKENWGSIESLNILKKIEIHQDIVQKQKNDYFAHGIKSSMYLRNE